MLSAVLWALGIWVASSVLIVGGYLWLEGRTERRSQSTDTDTD